MLHAWLTYLRDTLEMKCEGLSHVQLARASVPPSPLSLLGLVRHLSNMEVSRLHWYAGDDTKMPFGHDDFEGISDADPARDIALWRELCRRTK